MRDYYGRVDLPWYAAMDYNTAIMGASTTTNMSTGHGEDKIKAQVEPQERNKGTEGMGNLVRGGPAW